MKNDNLTGIERELALQYLMDGNVPVTVTLSNTEEEGEISHVHSAVLPIVVQSQEMTLLKDGIIILKNPNQEITSLINKNVRIEFYFNSVGLFFPTIIKKISAGLAFVIPDAIYRIQNTSKQSQYDFSASVYYSCSNTATVNFDCIPLDKYELFSRPVWKSIPLQNQKIAKTYLEQFVEETKATSLAGTGLQLIPICRYLSENSKTIEALQGIVKPLNILYVDHERIIFASENENFPLMQGAEYALKLSFSIKEGPIVKREMFATGAIVKLYRSANSNRTCCDCVYTSVQE
ncbi:MAG: hypothetical protein IJR49_02340, partial [Treponema sp.]|nr:hypothetical protein [Treponema sp.]